MDRSCWKEKSGNALRLRVQVGPELNEWNQGSSQTFGHFFWLPFGEHRAFCSSVAVDILFQCCFWHLVSSKSLFAQLIVVKKVCFQLGFGFLMQSRSQRALPCELCVLILLHQLSLLGTPDFPTATCAHLLHHNFWCMSFTCSFFTVSFHLQSPQNPLLVAVPLQMSVS